MKRKAIIEVVFLLTITAGLRAQWVEESKLTASDGVASDYFGYSVGVSGDFAILGAYGDDDKGSNAGSAYIFQRDNESWTQKAKLSASDGAASDYFGRSVAISGEYAIAGVPYEDPTYTDAGSAYVFEKPPGGWANMTQNAKLMASDRAAYDYFGCSVSASGDCAIVGAYGDDSAGSAYIFKRVGGLWTQNAKLSPSDGASGDNFGYSVLISGDYVIIGSPYDDDSGTDSGSAYIYKWTGTNWAYMGKLRPFGGAPYDYFGWSVSISGSYAIVGAYYGDGKVSDSGSAYIFGRSGEVWTEVAKLTASDGAASDYFGLSVALDGNNVVIGAYGHDTNGIDSGAVYRFERPLAGWVSATETEKLIASDGAAYDYLGVSVSVSGNYCLSGAYCEDDKGSDAGATYVFGRPGPLVITAVHPPEDFISCGDEGGPFQPDYKDYTLTNEGPDSLDWAAGVNCSWLNVAPNTGTLLPDETATVTISIDAGTNDFEPGAYNCNIIFTDFTNGYNQLRDVILDVNKIPGAIEVTDSIGAPHDLNMPFGSIIVGLTRTEQVTIANTDPCARHELTIYNILLSNHYFENFDDGQAQNWSEHPNGQWQVVSGEYHAYSSISDTVQSIYSGARWQNCSAEVTIRESGSGGIAGLILRASDDFSFPDGTGSAYLLYIDDAGDFFVAEYVSGEYIDLWSDFSPYLNTGTSSNVVRVVAEGSTIKVYFNGNLAWSGTGDVADAGWVGLWAIVDSSYSYYFDDVEVLSLQSAQEFNMTIPTSGPPWTVQYGVPLTLEVNYTPVTCSAIESVLSIMSDDKNISNLIIRLSGAGILDYLQIVPDANFEFSGHPGGPFMPWRASYQLHNDGPNSIDWAASPNVPWLDVFPSGGTLAPYKSLQVSVMPNSQAEVLQEGYYCGEVNFVDLTTTVFQKRRICLRADGKSKIWTSPCYFDVNLTNGQTDTQTLIIGNTGSSSLDFSLSSHQTSFTLPLTQQSSGGTAYALTHSGDINHDFTVPAPGASFRTDRLLVRFAPQAGGRCLGAEEKNVILTNLEGASVQGEYKIVPGLCRPFSNLITRN